MFRIICYKGLYKHRGLRDGPCLQEAECLFGGQEKMPRAVEVGVHRRKGPPRPGEFRESFPGGGTQD